VKKFYAASSFKNIEAVRYISKQLIDRGYIQTYDWTRNERASTFKDLKEIGQKEKAAVMEADVVIVLLPAGKGSHRNGDSTWTWETNLSIFTKWRSGSFRNNQYVLSFA